MPPRSAGSGPSGSVRNLRWLARFDISRPIVIYPGGYMTPTHTIDVSTELAAAPQAVWDRISNHAHTHTWVKLASVRLLEEGQPAPNGTGALREVSFPSKRMWTTVKERIVAYDAPKTFSYKVIEGMPG